MKRLLLVSLALATLSLPLGRSLQAQGTNPNSLTVEGGVAFINPGSPVVPEAQANSQPVPRLPGGRIDLTGPWVGGGTIADIERDGGLKPGEMAFLPWAQQLRMTRKSQDDPYTVCLPMAVLRTNPYPWKFGMAYTSKGLSHMYILHELGDAGAHRVVYMDGRKHPDDLLPSWWGHSIGRWDGDTLVIDTVGYNEKFWFDSRGTPHTEKLHTIERWTRINYGTLINEFTIDDPGTFSRPVQLKFTATLVRPDIDLMEFICLENNQVGLAGGYVPGKGTTNK